jgi:Glycosyl transferase family 2
MGTGEVWAVMMAANEESIIGYTISHLISQGIDGIMVCLNNSTDNTRYIINDIWSRNKRVIFISDDPNTAFYQSAVLTDLARDAVEHGAEWVLPLDADELAYSEDSTLNLCDAVRRCDHQVIHVSLLNHYATDQDIDSPNPFKAHPWRHVDLNPLGKMIVRFQPKMVIDNGNHRILVDGGALPACRAGISVRHFSAIDADRWVRKSIANATALEADPAIPVGVGAHVRMYKHHADVLGAAALKDFYMEHFYFRHPNDKLVYSPAPYRGEL